MRPPLRRPSAVSAPSRPLSGPLPPTLHPGTLLAVPFRLSFLTLQTGHQPYGIRADALPSSRRLLDSSSEHFSTGTPLCCLLLRPRALPPTRLQRSISSSITNNLPVCTRSDVLCHRDQQADGARGRSRKSPRTRLDPSPLTFFSRPGRIDSGIITRLQADPALTTDPPRLQPWAKPSPTEATGMRQAASGGITISAVLLPAPSEILQSPVVGLL